MNVVETSARLLSNAGGNHLSNGQIQANGSQGLDNLIRAVTRYPDSGT